MKDKNTTRSEKFKNLIDKIVENTQIHVRSLSLAWYKHFNEKWRSQTLFMDSIFPSLRDDAVMQVFSKGKCNSKTHIIHIIYIDTVNIVFITV